MDHAKEVYRFGPYKDATDCIYQVPNGRSNNMNTQNHFHELDPYGVFEWYRKNGMLDGIQRMIHEAVRKYAHLHYSKILWHVIAEKIEKGIHPPPPQPDGKCRNPECDRSWHEDINQFLGYCCKLCAIRFREQTTEERIIVRNALGTNHGPCCQGKSCR